MFFKANIKKKGQVMRKVGTHKKRLFLKKMRTIKFTDSISEVYLRVDYGKSLDIFGKITIDRNDGFYEDREKLWQAISAFVFMKH